MTFSIVCSIVSRICPSTILSTIAYVIVFGCPVYFATRCLGNPKHPGSLPPGPPGLPWIGNVIGIDMNAPWLTYREWAKTYGDLLYSRLLGKDIIIINSEKVAKDILDKGSSNNSSRPYFITSELCGIDFNSAFLPYGDRWRLHRRLLHQTFRCEAVSRFLPFHHKRACNFLRRLLHTPEEFDEHIYEYTASVILSSAYDYDPPTREDELFKLITEVQDIALSVVRPDVAIIVATFPILLKLPAWLPGMSFKNDMATASKLTNRYVEATFEYALQRVRACSATPSIVHDAVRGMEEKGTLPDSMWMKGVKEAAATALLAASETSHSVLLTFFLMMMMNPGVQERAQMQIDAVVGKNRLPEIDDRPLLPLVDAIFRELLRCHPVVPLSVPHVAVDDYAYNGFRIPKGAIILTNLWSMAHNESIYPNSNAFIPERFLNDDGSLKPNDIEHIAYGFGRRICVGRHFADRSVWSVMVKVLAVFKIMKPVDENGAELTIEPKFSSGLSSRPLPFKCRIVPRIHGMDVVKLEELIVASTP